MENYHKFLILAVAVCGIIGLHLLYRFFVSIAKKCLQEPEYKPATADADWALRAAKIQYDLLQLQVKASMESARYTNHHECAGCGYESNLWRCPKCRRMHRENPLKNQRVRWF